MLPLDDSVASSSSVICSCLCDDLRHFLAYRIDLLRDVVLSLFPVVRIVK